MKYKQIAAQRPSQRHDGVRNSSTAQLGNSGIGGTAGENLVGGNGEAALLRAAVPATPV